VTTDATIERPGAVPATRGDSHAPTALGTDPAGTGTGVSDSGLPFGHGGPTDRILRLLPMTVATSTATTLTLAFLVFGKRRRDEEPPASDADLARAAASPYTFVTASDLVTPQTVPAANLPALPAFDPGTGGTDVDLPRWRRPSLMAARKSDPVRDGAIASRLTFENAPTTAGVDGTERRRIRYRIVRLLDRPDELLGVEVGSLDEGDEVAILEQQGTYRRVLTPDGRQGWLHRMTLGDIVDHDIEPELAVTDGPALEPDAGADMLLAYLAARARG
jgi:hypothetical protein